MKKKVIALVLVCVLVFGIAVGGTLAWLAAKTETVTNTFTAGDVEITLTETTGSTYDMLPGDTIAKDPVVTVLKGSEDCYVFVQVAEANNTFDTNKKIVQYTIDSSVWTQLNGVTNVYYKEVTDVSDTTDLTLNVITGEKVTINSDATAGVLETAETNKPAISFTAYAVQKKNVDTVTDAWDIAQDLQNNA